ncbi:hypothetical protein GQ457_13G017990 [Hibiscus cannabinus]
METQPSDPEGCSRITRCGFRERTPISEGLLTPMYSISFSLKGQNPGIGLDDHDATHVSDSMFVKCGMDSSPKITIAHLT